MSIAGEDISAGKLPLLIPVGIQKTDLDYILFSAQQAGAADISFASGEPVVARIRGEYVNVTQRGLQHNEVQNIACFIYGDNAISVLGSGEALDPRYSFPVSRGKRVGFRVNMTQCLAGQVSGAVQITCRSLPGLPTKLEDLDVPLDICRAFFGRQGLIIVAGETGSGKSTLLAGFFRTMAERARNHKLLTFEEPVEYTYGEVPKHPTNFIYQQEIGRDLQSFPEAVANALRRAPTDCLIGESRNKETISGTIELALTGVKTYTTVHAETPGGVISRLVQAFPYDDHASITEKLIGNAKLIVVQKLIKRIDGKQAAINCWITIDKETRAALHSIRAELIGRAIDDICFQRGTTFEHHAASRVRKGQVSLEVAAYSCGVPPKTIEKIIDEMDNDAWSLYESDDFSEYIV